MKSPGIGSGALATLYTGLCAIEDDEDGIKFIMEKKFRFAYSIKAYFLIILHEKKKEEIDLNIIAAFGCVLFVFGCRRRVFLISVSLML